LTPSSTFTFPPFSPPPPQWEWGNQDSFAGNVGTVLGHGGGDGWYRVQWDQTNTSNSYQYMPEHQDIARFNDPLENPLAALFPAWASEDERQYVKEEATNGGEHESVGAVLNATNTLSVPGDALAEAGLSSLLTLLDEGLWRGVAGGAKGTGDHRSCQLVWGALAQLGLGSASRGATILQHPSAQAAVAAALAHVIGEGVGSAAGNDEELELDGALLLLASAARTGPAAVVHARLVGERGLLPALVRIMTTDAGTAAGGSRALLALSTLDALVGSGAEGPSPTARDALAAVLREDPALWDAFVAVSLDGLLEPTRVCQAAAHVMVLRLLRAVLGEASDCDGRRDGSGALEAPLLPWQQVKDRLVWLLEAYAGLAESVVVMEELLLLMVAWIGRDGASRAEAAAMTILANALLDRFDRVNDTLLHAPRAVLLAAPGLLRRAVLSKGTEGAARERSVDRLLRAGTLNFLFEGDYDWAGRESGHVLELRALLQLLLQSGGPGREEQVVSLPLVRALLPVLRSPGAQGDTEEQHAQDAVVVAGVLRILADRLPSAEKQGLACVRPRLVGGPHLHSHPQQQGRRRRRQRLLWGALGGDLASAVCATYRRFARDGGQDQEEVGALALRILASVVAETGVLEQQHLDVLLAETRGARGEDGSRLLPLPPMAAAKLRIVGAACRSFEADANVDTDALVGTVVEWLDRASEDKAVMDAALQLLLNLVDNARA
jgi:hypothetical protein